VQEKLLPGELGVSPRILLLIFPQEWGLGGLKRSDKATSAATNAGVCDVRVLGRRPDTRLYGFCRGACRGAQPLCVLFYPPRVGDQGVEEEETDSGGP